MGGVANISMVRADDAEVESKVVRPASWVVFLFLWLIRVQWGDSSVVERWIPDPAVGGSIPSHLLAFARWLLIPTDHPHSSIHYQSISSAHSFMTKSSHRYKCKQTH